jgi:hypothetical protein
MNTETSIIVERARLLDKIKRDYGKNDANVFVSVVEALEKRALNSGRTTSKDLSIVFGKNAFYQLKNNCVAVPLNKALNKRNVDRPHNGAFELPEISGESKNWYLICKLEKDGLVVKFTLQYEYAAALACS